MRDARKCFCGRITVCKQLICDNCKNKFLKCFCCGKIIDTEIGENPLVVGPAYEALWFRATGNFGSTVFDPMPIGVEEILQILICDDCIKKNIKQVTHIYNINRETTCECGEFMPTEPKNE